MHFFRRLHAWFRPYPFVFESVCCLRWLSRGSSRNCRTSEFPFQLLHLVSSCILFWAQNICLYHFFKNSLCWFIENDLMDRTNNLSTSIGLQSRASPSRRRPAGFEWVGGCFGRRDPKIPQKKAIGPTKDSGSNQQNRICTTKNGRENTKDDPHGPLQVGLARTSVHCCQL